MALSSTGGYPTIQGVGVVLLMYYSPLRMNVTYVNYTVKGAAKDEKKVR